MRSIHRVVLALLLTAGCTEVASPPECLSGTRSETSADSLGTGAPRRLESTHLPNPVEVHPHVISGGSPEGEAAFQELVDLGVKTIISVDGAKPDVETARRFGLRYVHLPHGYDGIPQQRARELARAVRDLERPIYIHCHHGRHRSPAAASVACVSAGLIPPSAALSVLRLAGTSPHYRGLFLSAEQAAPLTDDVLDALAVDYREVVEVAPMAEAMVALERTHDHVQKIAEAGWSSPAGHPDLDPVHEVLLLREHFTELLRSEELSRQPRQFAEMLRESETAAGQLEAALGRWQRDDGGDSPPSELNARSRQISANCKRCHQTYRDASAGGN